MAPALKVAFKLGDGQVHAVTHGRESARPVMIHVHDDETTAVEAGRVHVAAHGGRLIRLAHSGQRLVSFRLGGREYAFDPNRMFSDAGIMTTLENHSTYSAAAHGEIKSLATRFLERFTLDREPVIIALHNIVEGRFSVESFAGTGYLREAAAITHISPRRSKFDFFYVTTPAFYDYLAARDFNVVLQDNARAPDDGSLSIYFARKGIPYLNVEAEMRHLPEQIAMLKTVAEMLAGSSD